MEHFPEGEESTTPERLRLDIDLSGPDGHWFNLISRARTVLEGDALRRFDQAIWEATQHGSGKTYGDILEIVNSYMDLIDTSGTYEAYAPRPPEA